MSYLTDNPLPLLLLLAAVAIAAFLTGSAKGRGVAGLCVLAGIGLFFLEQYLVSPAEEVEIQVEQMLQNFKDRDLAAITSQISIGSKDLVDAAKRGLEIVDLTESFHIKGCDVTVGPKQQKATARLRANGPVNVKSHGGGTQHVPTMWSTEWAPEDGGWKLKSVQRLSPATGEKMGYFSAK